MSQKAPLDEAYTADEAARILNISKETLYAYVSRGLVRSEPGNSARRTRCYSRDDIDLLSERKAVRRNPEAVASRAIRFGLPIMESAITCIRSENFYYRGQPVDQLAQSSTFEEVCSLLWVDESSRYRDFFSSTWPKFDVYEQSLLNFTLKLQPIARLQCYLPLWEDADFSRFEHDSASLAKQGATLIRRYVRIWNPETVGPGSISQVLSKYMSMPVDLLDDILILCADHELTTSSFTTRCSASTGSHLYSAVNAGLSAFRGHKHGGASSYCETLLREMFASGSASSCLIGRLERGDKIGGFGHPLYKEGDPRGRILLDELYKRVDSPITGFAKETEELMKAHFGQGPNVDFALAALCLAYDLPVDSSIYLFSLARIAGLIAHAIEEYDCDRLIRPRTKYVGQSPRSEKL